jgi:integrase
MTALGRLAGITRRVHAHGLRHTMASELREEGLDIGIISKQLGHRSITTTARYLDHIAPLAVLQAMAKRTW